jgi:tetratricopeptide (TPR) repeat protein
MKSFLKFKKLKTKQFFSKRIYVNIIDPPKLKANYDIKLNELEESEIQLSKSNYREAISNLTRGEMIIKSIFGEKHELTQNIQSKLSFCYIKQEKYQNAIKILEKLFKLQTENSLEEKLFLYNNLIFSYSKQENYKGKI